MVAEHHLIENADRELRELEEISRVSHNLVALFSLERFGHAAGDARNRMNSFSANQGDDALGSLAQLDHLLSGFETYFSHHAQDISLGRGRVGTHNKIRSAQGVEVQGMIAHKEGRIQEFAKLLRGGRRLHVEYGVASLDAGHVVRLRANAADSSSDARHFLDRAPHTELLEAPQLRHLKIGVRDLAVVIEEDSNLPVAFQPRHWIYQDFSHLSLHSRHLAACDAVSNWAR